MIKFFRHIRQNLLMENKTGKYFKYAIGEIILVVIGILIALQINNWNATRIEKEKEQSYINELINDVRKDASAIDELLVASNNQLKAKYKLQRYLKEHTDLTFYLSDFSIYPEYIRKETYDSDSLMYYYRMQWQNRKRFTPITTTIDEMKSTGKIGIIIDKKLRRTIIETYNSYDDFLTSNQDRYLETQKELLKFVIDEIPELYQINNSNITEIFQNQRVLNRLEANFVSTLNRGLLDLKQLNQNLLNELKKFQK
ncbi:hypothetical protein J4050_05075 [Winogradskyella sp. DF17]|uniref:Uncharacterized protein n=1 Tax=Winogradskyella pelagia TaxID=2819984 RepID=A0ABS3T041_9FLAO|nr:DUF6090 family protein [Winogradskyella sp. DF17]MBO3116107.1 hypothetical protein [Winogradskyella sp. DF17]